MECWGIREWRAGIGAVWNAGIRGMACGNRSGVEMLGIRGMACGNRSGVECWGIRGMAWQVI